MTLSATEVLPGSERLQELLYGEALFHSHQQDYITAISRLQLAEAQGRLPPSSEEARLLLARMKLAYGMHLEAGFELHALLGETVPPAVRNRAWYELARAFFHKGYTDAAEEALAYVQGEMPADIVGDHQLLRATVLMSLNKNREAAQELTQWRGAPELAAYAHYNRGIALVRAGDYAEVVPALKKAVAMPARGEELLALRDKARLALGYSFARDEDYRRARRQLEAVRPEGPLANRALLALGWLEYKQGHSESALISWTELRGRSPADPAVLETLLVVPAVHRDLEAMHKATRDYEAAMTAYSNELNYLQNARASVLEGSAVPRMLQHDGESGQGATAQAGHAATRFLGPMLASRGFMEMLYGHEELQALLDEVDRGLVEIDVLQKVIIPADQGSLATGSPLSTVPAVPETSQPLEHAPGTGKTSDPLWRQEWVERRGQPTEHPAPEIPALPEIESPARRALKPFPERHAPSRPQVSGYIREPPNAKIIGMPETGILWLPDSGEFFKRPQSGEFFRRPGEQEDEDYAYPDLVPQKGSTPGEYYAYPVNRLLPASEDDPGFDAGAVPVGEALRELAAALNSSTDRMAALGQSTDSAAGLEEQVAALRTRILKLRARIANALVLYEDYTRAMALDELNRRQLLLEDLLEQASLELAKTYDQSSDR
ncbi:MAG: tetratricopeptide repeat protein [Halioglobus sp.]